MSISSQSQSPLFKPPTEIRNQIYSYIVPNQIHLSHFRGKSRVTRCHEPREETDESRFVLDGIEFIEDFPYSDGYKHAIRSSWGHHWRCTDVGNEERWSDILRVCKRLGLEIADMVARIGTLHITDLDTMRSLQDSSPEKNPFSLVPLFTGVSRLNITHRLPLPFCRALEESYCSQNTDLRLSKDIQAWGNLGTTLSQLKSLRNLRIWIDYDGPEPWSVVHERALLSCLTPLYTDEELNITISLPKLHPKYENEERHFTKGTHIPFHIIRRLRQSTHTYTYETGGIGITERSDFPFLLVLEELEAEMAGKREEWGFSAPEYPSKSMAEIEEEERQQWRNGRDVEAETAWARSELSEELFPSACTGFILVD